MNEIIKDEKVLNEDYPTEWEIKMIAEAEAMETVGKIGIIIGVPLKLAIYGYAITKLIKRIKK